MNVLISGQKWFGAEVLRELLKIEGVIVKCVSAPCNQQKEDKLWLEAGIKNIDRIVAGTLNHATMPDNIDLIIAAHSYDFIGEKTRLKARFGGIGYHPSLLPVHRGRDAVRWAIKMNDKVTGGTVYRLSNKIDGGEILAQQHVFIRPDDDAGTLWRRDLAPLGVELLRNVVAEFKERGYIAGEKQDESLATYEPSFDRPPVFRPDLIMLGCDA